MKQMVNGIEVDLTPEEEAEFNARQEAWAAQAPQRMVEQFTINLEQAINDKAAEKSYSSGVSCATYKDSTNSQWAAEAQAFVAWRDSCYEYGYDYLSRAQSGEIHNPTLEDFLNGLPTMIWPEQ
jgi:hypothetical protein